MQNQKVLCFWSVLFSFILRNSISLDNITPVQYITDGQTLISSGGTFELGFYSPGNSNGRYLGIWYHNIFPKVVVWVANREKPLNNTFGVLKLTGEGLVVLINDSTNSSIVWSSNMSSKVEDKWNPVAQLLESGNLVVKDGHNGDHFLWQSFDYPCDTFLPGMKLGWDLVTGLERTLSSSKSTDDPGRGDYTFRIDLRGDPQIVLMKGTAIKIRVGAWNGLMFSGATLYLRYSQFSSQFVFNEKEVFTRFRPENTSKYIRGVVYPWGGVQVLHWSIQTRGWETLISIPEAECDKYALCGANSVCRTTPTPVCACLEGFVPKYPGKWKDSYWSDGCVRVTPLRCSRDGFKKVAGVVLPDTSTSWYNRTMDLLECREFCLKNCSCTAYSNLDIRDGGSGCLIWFHDLVDIRQGSQDFYIRIDDKQNNDSSKRKLAVIVVGSILFIMSIIFGLKSFLWRKKLEESDIFWLRQRDHKKVKESMDLPTFDLSTIVCATDQFSSSNELGKGGYGPVYKGVLANGTEIAVKRLSKNSDQGLQEFKTEVQLIAKLQHRNLVKLLGCCIQQEEKLLIYELMPNRSLDYFIFDDARRKLLDWTKRFHIISGTARGLVYLHQDSRLRVIHRDLKTSNILLDEEMNAKISDFGLARTFASDQTEDKTGRVVGTHGYISPEYAVRGSFSMKSDVFAFGVIVLEVVSGRKTREFCVPDQSLNLLGFAWELWNEERTLELVDESLRDSVNEDEVLRCIQIGLLCVQERPEHRPNMSSVVRMLDDDKPLPRPRLPAFYSHQQHSTLIYGEDGEEVHSANEVTISLLGAR
ncbi:G-type lectin S-receptor-like serine/threonine-protein kinase At4g27290 [Arachis hypogaea]|uniref:G-type lectin S-receptor-like serine/threonine-protein kinase At4g27290 n=1 Tax=Arachis hypogaea TaxID=3818 RepID=UPI000DED9320|nr:G-type lectin S-receptor-like serine/threonine-protein kinase At4g27290 [Arachis hypogaea]QHN95980.1 G-type lectin S-receptor-like serine/threonine-protein kinase [Arachis hypogaea]